MICNQGERKYWKLLAQQPDNNNNSINLTTTDFRKIMHVTVLDEDHLSLSFIYDEIVTLEQRRATLFG